jgi:aldose 1-epimerase
MIEIGCGAMRIGVAPEVGGGLSRASFDGLDVLRPAPLLANNPLDLACFPLVPFSNRLANQGLRPNSNLSPHAIHGYGWLHAWSVAEAGAARVRLRHQYASGDWPWSYESEQTIEAMHDGYSHEIALWNRSDRSMPAGIGLHPYFARDDDTVFAALFTGEWQVDQEQLPKTLTQVATPQDWWRGAPIGSRIVDTGYVGRRGEMRIAWPSRGLRVRIAPDDALAHTVIYVPAGQPFFCVEPVSHMTNPLNHYGPGVQTGLQWLAPGTNLSAKVRLFVTRH